MSTTARNVIYRALRLIRAIDPTETPEAQEVTDSLQALNEMMHGLENHAIYMDWEDIALNDDMPNPNRDIRPITYLLAAEIAPEFGKDLTPEVAVEARGAKAILQAWYGITPQSRPDLSITDRLSRYGNVYNIKTDTV